MFYGEMSPLSGSNSFQLASKLPSSLFSPSFDRSSTLTSRLFTSIPPVIKSSAVCFRFRAAVFCFLMMGRVIRIGVNSLTSSEMSMASYCTLSSSLAARFLPASRS